MDWIRGKGLKKMKELKNNKVGRPPYNPSDADREKVSRMCSLGTPQADIAIVMGMSATTLRKHFREEIKRASIDANLEVAETLFKMATSGKDVAATIFWAKVRNGFRTTAPAPPENKKQSKQLNNNNNNPATPLTIEVINNDGAPIATK